MKLHGFPTIDAKIGAALIALLYCIYGAFWSYHQLYMKTPDYAFSTIITTAQRGDMPGLTQSVATDTLAQQLFDSITQRATQEPTALSVLPLSWSPLKEEFAAASDQVLTGYIVGDTTSDTFHAAQGSWKGTLKALEFPIPAEGWQYEGVHWSRLTGDGTAEITADFYNTTLQATIPIALTMERGGTASWHITGLAHPDELLTAIHAAYAKQLAQKNAPMQQQIDKLITIKAVSAKLMGSPQDEQRFLRIQYTPEFTAKRQDIDEIKGTYTLVRKSDQATLFTADLHLSTASEKQTYQAQFLLNPLIPSQYKLIQHDDLSDMDSYLTVTSVRLKDGTTYAVSNQLWPEDTKNQD